MSYYWESDIGVKEPSSQSGTKILAVIIVLMLVIAGGVIVIFRMNPLATPPSGVRVAVLDTGIDIDFALQGRIVSQRSFITVENGYGVNDESTSDSKPEDTPHGTMVAKTVIADSASAMIVNARVLDLEGSATLVGIIAAIHWAVEENCSVINLSLGSTPSFGDPLQEIVKWAFDQGVVVVAAAGNDGQDGIAGTSIDSPGLFPYCLAAAALHTDGTPAGYSGTGPTASRYMKPDIAAPGYYQVSGATYFGTSFASPRVAGAAAELIGYCLTNNITYTPGSIMTALLMGASSMPYEEYVVGAGMLDLQASTTLVAQTSVDGNLPAISYAHPKLLPLDFETLFYGDIYQFSIQLMTSGLTDFEIDIDSDTPAVFGLPSHAIINQTGFIPLIVEIPDTGPSIYEADITFTSDAFGYTGLTVYFDVSEPAARVAFDISHAPWSIDTVYGQFKEFYITLTSNNISVTEIRNGTQTTLEILQEFDAVVVLDPCAWELNYTSPSRTEAFSIPFTEGEKAAYEAYYESGGGIFVAALSNDSLDIASVNDFLNWSGFAMGYMRIPSMGDSIEITQVESHIITAGVESFDFYGGLVTMPENATALANYSISIVLASMQDDSGGRIVVAGTNFFIDSWGMLGMYAADDDALLALKIMLWVTHLM
ncbi:MAG: S8 family serine peptidase [Candidatus Thorarchaeota archaeon]